ncbi:MAG TPA: DUF488 domain-containing protein [Thermodesulfovibrionia bacterium]|nr:DUF488 domain-containing protein [Thermodesulfovibrionia bacterium]
MNKLYTIGHSTHETEQFIRLLLQHKITAVCDVRSHPYSQFTPQFNREIIQKELKNHRITYVYLGYELGPRHNDPEYIINGKVQYEKLSDTERFRHGLERLKKGMQSHRIALMCSEKDPTQCHRMILICRHMRSESLDILHILDDGSLEKNHDAEKRLMALFKIPEHDLFHTLEDQIQHAYDIQSKRIAYAPKLDDLN